MATVITRFTRNQLESRVRCLKEHNQRIRQELSTIIHEKTALEEKFHIGIEHLEEEYGRKRSEDKKIASQREE